MNLNLFRRKYHGFKMEGKKTLREPLARTLSKLGTHVETVALLMLGEPFIRYHKVIK